MTPAGPPSPAAPIDEERRPQRGGARQVLDQRLLLAGIERAAPVAIERLPQRARRLAGRHFVVDEELHAGRPQPQELMPRMRDVMRQRRAREQQRCRGPPQKVIEPLMDASGSLPSPAMSMAPGS